jgi:hypothetical protein
VWHHFSHCSRWTSDPQSPWSPVSLRLPLRPLNLVRRLTHDTTSGRQSARLFGAQESILPCPAITDGSGSTRSLIPTPRSLALESKVPPSRYFASRPPTRLDQIQRPTSPLSQGSSTTSRRGQPALRNQDEWNINEPGKSTQPPSYSLKRNSHNCPCLRFANLFFVGSLKPTLRMHCRRRGCGADPCIEPTAAMCGHIFCNACITRAVAETSACPLCANPTLLYCLFRLRLEE